MICIPNWNVDEITGPVACMGRTEMHTKFWWGNVKENPQAEHPGVNRIDGSSNIRNGWRVLD